MASLLATRLELTDYRDNKYPGTREQFEQDLLNSNTLYVGNLSFYTTEEQIHELFSKCGEIKRIIMGLDRIRKTPCGFCFVEYYSHEDAVDCMKLVNGTKLDERVVRTDWDPGYREGRQFGRGLSGGQVRDEFRLEYDAGRGGWGPRVEDENQAKSKLEEQRGADLERDYVAIAEVPKGFAASETTRGHASGNGEFSFKRYREEEEEEPAKRIKPENVRFDRKAKDSDEEDH